MAELFDSERRWRGTNRYRTVMVGYRTMKLLPLPDLFEKLTQLASADDPEDLDHAFWAESGELPHSVRDSMEALMHLAGMQHIGWKLNAGWRCDVPFHQYSIEVCDNKDRGPETHFDLQASTPQGALAAGILVVMQERARRGASADSIPLAVQGGYQAPAGAKPPAPTVGSGITRA